MRKFTRLYHEICQWKGNNRLLSTAFIRNSVIYPSKWFQNYRNHILFGSLLIGATFASKAKCSSPNNTFLRTQSGLQYRDTKRGEGETAVPGNSVRVHYSGWLNGFDSNQKFDSSVDRGEPLTFTVGKGQVISGWDEALLTDMPVGTIREVIIPPQLGYGSRGAGNVIPPNATLYFRMELVSIAPPSKFQQILSKLGL